MTVRRFAEQTRVPIQQTRMEIETILTRYGARAFAYAGNEERAQIMFEAKGRRIRFDLPLPKEQNPKAEREKRRLWRSLALAIKSKLDCVESKIETFEEAFMAHVVMPDNKTVYQHAQPLIADAYTKGKMQPLLPDYSGGKT